MYALCALFFAVAVSLTATAMTWYIANCNMENIIDKINPVDSETKSKTTFLAQSTYTLKNNKNIDLGPNGLPLINWEISPKKVSYKPINGLATEIPIDSKVLFKQLQISFENHCTE
jgi:hypothetical protein